MLSRKTFICNAAGALLLAKTPFAQTVKRVNNDIKIGAHLWVYASAFPPDWDATPVLETAFSDIKKAGFAGIELMEAVLRHDDAVPRLKALMKKYALPVWGTSYSADMWVRERHDAILQDVVLVTTRLQQLGGTMFGISVGDAGRNKTGDELQVQADTLQEIMRICAQRNMVPNLHNHTYELRNDMHDLKETLQRVPHIKLGPDINWLIRGGVNPVDFIETYGSKIVYLHLRDQKATGKWTEALGEGVTDFAAIASALKRINFSGLAAVELAYDDKPVNTTANNWQKSRAFIKKTFGW